MSPHFSLAEMVFSETAVRHGLSNEPDTEETLNLEALCDKVLEPARAALGPIRITSGFRAPRVNALVGGAPRSQHMEGKAADAIPVNATLREYFVWLFEHAPFDQLIWEFGRWVHVSFDRMEQGRRILMAAFRPVGMGTVYRMVQTPQQAFDLVGAV